MTICRPSKDVLELIDLSAVRSEAALSGSYIVQSSSASGNCLFYAIKLVPWRCKAKLDRQISASDSIDSASNPEKKGNTNTHSSAHYSCRRVEDAGS